MAKAEIQRLMGEHFDSALFIYEITDPHNDRNQCYSYTTNCSYAVALGLATYAQDAILHPREETENA